MSELEPVKNEKPVKSKKKSYLDVISIFSSIQGEGTYVGQQMTFLRLARCNLECEYCDTEFNETQVQMSFFDIENRLFELGNTFVVITGGEPALQAPSLSRLLKSLHGTFKFHIETNGTLTLGPALPFIDHVTVSPKGFISALKVERADTIKLCVDFTMKDLGWYLNEEELKEKTLIARNVFVILHTKYSPREIFLSPVMYRNEKEVQKDTEEYNTRSFMQWHIHSQISDRSLRNALNIIALHPEFKLNLQIHKFIGIA